MRFTLRLALMGTLLVSHSSYAINANECVPLAKNFLEKGAKELEELQGVDSKRLFWQALFGQKVNAQEIVKRNKIVQLDHQLEIGNYKAAMDVIIETDMMSPNGKIRTVRNIFRDLEAAQVSIWAAQTKLDKIQSLILKYPEKATALQAVLEREQKVLEYQEKVFAGSYFYYMGLRRHLESALTKEVCEDTVCQKSAQYLKTSKFLRDGMGLNDTLLKSSNWLDTSRFVSDLKAAGVSDEDLPAKFLNRLKYENIDRETLLTFDNIARTSQSFRVRKLVLENEKWDQISLTTRLFLSQPILMKALYRALAILPAGKKLQNLESIQKIFSNVINAHASYAHFYQITMLLRSTLTVDLKLLELKNVALIDPSFIETFIRRSDTTQLREAMHEIAKKEPDNYGDLAEQLSQEASDKAKKVLGEMTPLYSKSVGDYMMDVFAVVASLYGVYRVSGIASPTEGADENGVDIANAVAAKIQENANGSKLEQQSEALRDLLHDAIKSDPKLEKSVFSLMKDLGDVEERQASKGRNPSSLSSQKSVKISVQKSKQQSKKAKHPAKSVEKTDDYPLIKNSK